MVVAAVVVVVLLVVLVVVAYFNPAVDVRWNSGRCHGHAGGTFSIQSAAVDSDRALREIASVVREPAYRGNF